MTTDDTEGMCPHTFYEHRRERMLMLPDPKVAIVVPTYNRFEDLLACVASIDAQTYDNIEIIVVNDGGESPAEALGVASISHAMKTPRGRYLYLADRHVNKGPAAALNIGFSIARAGTGCAADYIGCLADDDRFLPRHVELLVEQLELGAAIAHTQAVIRVQQKDEHGAWKDYGINEHTFMHPCTREQCALGGNIPISALLGKRELWAQVGECDEVLKFSDLDWLMRIGKIADIAFVPVVTVEITQRAFGSHHGLAQSSSFEGVHNLLALFAKHPTMDARVLAARQQMVLQVFARDPAAPWIFGPTKLTADIERSLAAHVVPEAYRSPSTPIELRRA